MTRAELEETLDTYLNSDEKFPDDSYDQRKYAWRAIINTFERQQSLLKEILDHYDYDHDDESSDAKLWRNLQERIQKELR